MAEKFQPIFVGGTGRSGTTIAINLLNRHSNIHSSLPREIKYLTSRAGLIDLVYGRPFSLEEDRKGLRSNLIARILPLTGKSKLDFFQKNLHGSWWNETGKKGKPRGLIQAITEQSLIESEKRFLEEFKVDPEKAARDLFYKLSNFQINQPGVKYFADSTPVNMMQSSYLNRLFPDALFLNMVRDGRDVAVSVASEKWGPDDPFQALDWWANRLKKAERSLSSIPDQRKLTLRLEQLVYLDRDSSYEKLLNFLGLESEAGLKSFFDSELSKEKLHEGTWKEKVDNPIKFERKYLKTLKKLKEHGIKVEKYY